MKLYQLICGAFLVGALASCSSNDAPAPETPSEGEKASGYLALSINLPQEILSRAIDDNVEFADGDDWEYGVNDAKLLLFTSTNSNGGNQAVFHSSHNLERAFRPTDPANDQISASSVEAVAVDIDNPDKTYLWALVMLNVPADLPMPEEGQKFSDYLKSTTDLSFVKTAKGKNYIFMTNASLSLKQGGTSNPTKTPEIFTLASLGLAEDAIKPSLQEAREKVAGCVYVERALAKLTAKVENADVQIKGAPGEDGTAASLCLVVDTENSTFGLDHINKSSYIVKNVVDFPATLDNEDSFSWDMSTTRKDQYYRMVGFVGMPAFDNHPLLHNEVNPQLYRTYWCVDPNYATSTFPAFDATEESGFKQIGSGALYTKENTFTVKNQNYGHATLAIFKITFKHGNEAKNLYILNGNQEAVYTTLKDAASNVYAYILAQDVVKEALQYALKEGVDVTGVNIADFLKINFVFKDEEAEAGELIASSIDLDKGVSTFSTYYGSYDNAISKFNEKITDSVKQDLLDRVNLLYIVTQYTGGVSYYAIPIMHFGEASTPWEASGVNQTDTKETYFNTSNRYDSENYLGRYGMVRNNWYEVNISKFTGLGSPVKPDFTGSTLSTDNNEVKKYIGVETHILSWAKRSQNVNF